MIPDGPSFVPPEAAFRWAAYPDSATAPKLTDDSRDRQRQRARLDRSATDWAPTARRKSSEGRRGCGAPRAMHGWAPKGPSDPAYERVYGISVKLVCVSTHTTPQRRLC